MVPSGAVPIHRVPFDEKQYASSGDVVAFAIVPSNAEVDWSLFTEPEESLWIPEVLVSDVVAAAAAGTLLASLNIHQQCRFSVEESGALLPELEAVAAKLTGDSREAVALILEVVEAHVSSGSGHLLVEGP